MARNCEGWEDVGRGERSLIRSDRPPEDRRPIEGLTSKHRPNSEPALLFFFFECHWAPTARFIFLPSANSNGDDEVYLFPLEPARDPWHTARLNLPAPACAATRTRAPSPETTLQLSSSRRTARLHRSELLSCWMAVACASSD